MARSGTGQQYRHERQGGWSGMNSRQTIRHMQGAKNSDRQKKAAEEVAQV